MAREPRDTMGGLAKGLRVIEAFTVDQPRLSIAQAAQASGLDRATTRRCLLTLAEQGYAAYDGKFFTVTPRVLRLGTGCLAAMPLPRIVQPMLDELSEQIGQSTSVSILDEADIVYVARAAHKRVMSVALMPGSRLPAYCTSMGRVLLAALPRDESLRILNLTPCAARTPFTLTRIEDVMEKLDEVRARGFAVIDQEVEIGLRSLAIPLFNARRVVVAALNVGLAATVASPCELEQTYLPALKAVQTELQPMLL